jgi:plastocyanin
MTFWVRLGGCGAIALSLLARTPASDATKPMSDIARFQFEPQAQRHCPGDTVVWIEARLQIYNVSSDRFYGRTTTGAFACLRDVEMAGYRSWRRQ